MSLLDELNKQDRVNRLASALNKRNSQLSSLMKQKEASEEKCNKLEQEIVKLKAVIEKASKKTAPPKRVKSYTPKRTAEVVLPKEELTSKESTNDDTE